MSHLYMALVGCVMKTRPLKFVLASTYGREAAWSMWKLRRHISWAEGLVRGLMAGKGGEIRRTKHGYEGRKKE